MYLVSSSLVLLSVVLNFKMFEAGVISTNAKTSIDAQKPIIGVLCFVDFDTFELHADGEIGEIADKKVEKYFLPFWKNVDRYFSLLDIRISLKGIIIAHSREEENTFLNSQKNRLFMDAFYSPNTLETFGKYIYSNPNLPSHDVAIVITQSVLCKEKESGQQSTGKNSKNDTRIILTDKFSNINLCETKNDVAIYPTGMCLVIKNNTMSHSVAIIRDYNKIYGGVRNAVFAIGRLLGISQDGDIESDAKDCKSEDGYFMSGNNKFGSSHKFEWSNCSIQKFKMNMNISRPDAFFCLFKQLNEIKNDSTGSLLPGQILTLDNYCYGLTHYKACSYNDVCSSLTCSHGEYCKRPIKGPAIEGSWCGENMRCSYGKCVPFPFHQ